MNRLKMVLAFVAAVVLTFVAASSFHTHFVMQQLVRAGADVPMADGARTMFGDMVGLAPAFGTIVAITLLLGFLIAALVKRWLPSLAGIAYPVAGGAAMAAMLAIMRAVFGMTPIAGARGWDGWIAICLAGVLGGWLFARLTRPKRR